MYEKMVNNKQKKLTSLTSEKTWASFNLQAVLHFVCFLPIQELFSVWVGCGLRRSEALGFETRTLLFNVVLQVSWVEAEYFVFSIQYSIFKHQYLIFSPQYSIFRLPYLSYLFMQLWPSSLLIVFLWDMSIIAAYQDTMYSFAMSIT